MHHKYLTPFNKKKSSSSLFWKEPVFFVMPPDIEFYHMIL